jgi:predicted dehydrogenase
VIEMRRGSKPPRLIQIEHANSYRLELENLADAIAGEAEPLLGREDAVAQACTIEALYRSADTGQPVSI